MKRTTNKKTEATSLLIVLAIILFNLSAIAQPSVHALRDASGRHIIGRGFVLTTNDAVGEIFYDQDDFHRMVRLGANYQVLRLEISKLGAYSKYGVQEEYLVKLDSLVALAEEVGIKTFFKMTLYGLNKFSWEDFWLNKNNEHQPYFDAWNIIWERYKNRESVVGYDIVNEPRKLTFDISYDKLTDDYLVPLYQKLIDASQKINKDKLCLLQTIFMNKGEAINGNQYAEIKTKINRENIIFSPHIYQKDRDLVLPTLKRFNKESKLINAPIFIGEWGFPTFDTTDSTMTGKMGQLNYMDFYIRTAEIFDSLGIGTIKAWFLGNRKKQNFMAGGFSTWAIFSDYVDVGFVERKYITDIIARPYPQAIAGDIDSFKYDFATRSLTVNLLTDNTKGSSRLFIGANRHYPDGFTILCDNNLILSHNPLKNTGLDVVKSNDKITPSDFIWNESTQQLTILKWPAQNKKITLKIIPGIYE